MKKRLAAIVTLVILVNFCTGCNDEYEKNETNAFSAQLKKNPSDWTQEETKRYNDFSDWVAKQ